MEIRRKANRDLLQGPQDYFSGNVQIDPLFMDAIAPSCVTGMEQNLAHQ